MAVISKIVTDRYVDIPLRASTGLSTPLPTQNDLQKRRFGGGMEAKSVPDVFVHEWGDGGGVTVRKEGAGDG